MCGIWLQRSEEPDDAVAYFPGVVLDIGTKPRVMAGHILGPAN